MLKSYKMQVRDGVLIYPEEIKEQFLETGDLVLREGTRVTPEEIWYFMTEEGPRKYPIYFSADPKRHHVFPDYVEFLSSIKIFYLDFSRRWRVELYKRAGMPLVFIQGGQLLDPYYAAGSIPARPFAVRRLAADYYTECLDERKRLFKQLDVEDEGNRVVSQDSCHQVGTHMEIRKGHAPVDLLAPSLNRRCSDCAYLVETHRDSERRTPSLLVDYPENPSAEKPWVVEYTAQSVRRLVTRLDEMTGRKTTDEDFRAQIRLSNKLRKLARDSIVLWNSAESPPGHSDLIPQFVHLGSHAEHDPVAALQVLEEFHLELKGRVQNSTKCVEISNHPVRLFRAGGSCFRLPTRQLHRYGAVEVAYDDGLNLISANIDETGDPYEQYAKAILSLPMEQSPVERARWTAEQAKRVRADGVIFGGQWGCNYTTAIMKMCSDIIQDEGVPVLTLELDDLGREESTEGTRTRIEAFIETLR